jgi:endonuclease YncB( thermonuclease family)
MRKLILGFFIIIVALSLTLVMPDASARGKGSSARYRSYKGAKAIDGDTFFYKGKRYRIQQYNAPELGEPGARQAKRDLQQKIDSGRYAWKPVAKDVYGRTVVKERKRR